MLRNPGRKKQYGMLDVAQSLLLTTFAITATAITARAPLYINVPNVKKAPLVEHAPNLVIGMGSPASIIGKSIDWQPTIKEPAQPQLFPNLAFGMPPPAALNAQIAWPSLPQHRTPQIDLLPNLIFGFSQSPTILYAAAIDLPIAKRVAQAPEISPNIAISMPVPAVLRIPLPVAPTYTIKLIAQLDIFPNLAMTLPPPAPDVVQHVVGFNRNMGTMMGRR
jgi:hypothetical protein